MQLQNINNTSLLECNGASDKKTLKTKPCGNCKQMGHHKSSCTGKAAAANSPSPHGGKRLLQQPARAAGPGFVRVGVGVPDDE